ncbi:MAG: hypothetical protein ABSF84_10970 [Acidimicrobiales bacterium]|jgi:hypothetical protein
MTGQLDLPFRRVEAGGLRIQSEISANRSRGRCVSIGSEEFDRGGRHTLAGRTEEVT